MSEYLSKIGSASYLHPWRVIFAWFMSLVILGVLAYNFATPTDSAITIPGTESQDTIDKVERLFPGTGLSSGRVVLKSEDGSSLLEQSKTIDGLVGSISKIDGVSAAIGPSQLAELVSKTGDIGFVQVQLSRSSAETDPVVFEMIDKAILEARTSNLSIEKSMTLSNMTPEDILGVGEVIGVVVAFLVLLATLGSLIAAGMPIISALVGVGVSMAGLFALSEIMSIGSTTPVLAIMLGLAVGIDYALFIINRYQALIRSGRSYADSIKVAIGTAGNAVVFAALTVVVALAALSVVRIPFMTTMGLVGAASVAVAAISAITLIPAMLGLARGRIFGIKEHKTIEAVRSKKAKANHRIDRSTVWFKWVSLVTARPIPTLIASLALVMLFAYPILDIKLGLPTDQYASESSTYKKAYDILEEGFGVGFNGPLLVLAEGLDSLDSSDVESKVKQSLTATVTMPDSVDQSNLAAGSISNSIGNEDANKMIQEQLRLAPVIGLSQQLISMDGVEEAVPVAISNDGSSGLIQIIPSYAPISDKTVQLIDSLRSGKLLRHLNLDTKLSFSVTGTTALEIDVSDKLAQALPIYLAVVVGLSLVLLVLAFRSILIPIKATVGFLASVLVMLGSVVAVFQWGWFDIAESPGPIVSFIPIIAIGILFGLAMDYEFFLVSSMRESYSKTKASKQSVVDGFSASGRVVAAAAVIMVSVFAGFVTSHDSTIQAMGFGLAVGIFFDAFIVRMTMVPAIMALLSDRAWWLPKWLDKRLPRVSIEGKDD